MNENQRISSIWIIITEFGEHAVYIATIHSLWDTKEGAEGQISKLRKAELAAARLGGAKSQEIGCCPK